MRKEIVDFHNNLNRFLFLLISLRLFTRKSFLRMIPIKRVIIDVEINGRQR